MRVMLVEEEIVAGIWHVSEELAKSNDPENNMKAVALVWCLEALGLDKPEENKRALSAGAPSPIRVPKEVRRVTIGPQIPTPASARSPILGMFPMNILSMML